MSKKLLWNAGLLLVVVLLGSYVVLRQQDKYETLCESYLFWNESTAVLQIRLSEQHWKGSRWDGFWLVRQWNRTGSAAISIESTHRSVFYVLQNGRATRMVVSGPQFESAPLGYDGQLYFVTRSGDKVVGDALVENAFRPIHEDEGIALIANWGSTESQEANGWHHDFNFTPGGFREREDSRQVDLSNWKPVITISKELQANGQRKSVRFRACDERGQRVFDELVLETWTDRPQTK